MLVGTEHLHVCVCVKRKSCTPEEQILNLHDTLLGDTWHELIAFLEVPYK